jgi:hypothetical protein
MIDPQPIDGGFDLLSASQDELGRTLAPRQEDSVEDAFKLPDRQSSLRAASADRELLRHNFSDIG